MSEKIFWHNLREKEIFKKLQTNPDSGLSFEQARERIKKYGLNKLPEEKTLPWFFILISQFQNPLIYILLFAAILTFFLKEFIDLWVILAVVFINTLVGFFQEYKADRTLFALKKVVVAKAKVLRDGIEQEILAQDLVPGDIIFVEAGDKVPADGRVIWESELQIVEAALTGESLPSSKSSGVFKKETSLADQENMVFMGTVVVRGRGRVVVTSTGLDTQIGQIAKGIKEIPEGKTPLQKRFLRFSQILGMILVILVLVILIFGIFSARNFLDMLLVSVALAVAAVPEGLPAAVTIILALGAQEIFRRKGLLRKLIAVETLGSCNVICTDKTGTLTKGEIVVDHIFTPQKDHFLALEIGMLCNNTVVENPQDELKDWIILGDPLEKALLLAGIQAGLDKEELEQKKKRIGEIPFNEERKFMATLHHSFLQNGLRPVIAEASGAGQALHKKQVVIYVKGAPEKIISLSKLTLEEKNKIKKELINLTSKGLRVIAVAYKETKEFPPEPACPAGETEITEKQISELEFVGLIGMKDPLRKEAKETIDLCKGAGIRVILITGDHKLTAKAIAEELGLPNSEENILEGGDLEKLNKGELEKIISRIEIYARCEPSQKIRIIDAWKRKGKVVAMTGDGVNDAPALKKADIGVALGSGTDVAKEASDLIILDNNLSTLVKTVEVGRNIFENIRKVTLYLLSDSFTEIILVGGSIFLGFPLPVLPVQILWVNLIEDGLPSVALAFEPGEKEVMKDKPRKLKEPILNSELKILIFIIGIFTDLILFAIYFWLLRNNGDLAYIRTFIFVSLGINSLLYVFCCRSLRKSLWRFNPFSNKFLNFSVAFGFLMLFLGIYFPPFQRILRTIPLEFSDWVLLFGIGLIDLVLIEFVKWIFIIKKKA